MINFLLISHSKPPKITAQNLSPTSLALPTKYPPRINPQKLILDYDKTLKLILAYDLNFLLHQNLLFISRPQFSDAIFHVWLVPPNKSRGKRTKWLCISRRIDFNLFFFPGLSWARRKPYKYWPKKRAPTWSPFSFVIERLNRVVKRNYYEISTKDEKKKWRKHVYRKLCVALINVCGPSR